MADEVKCVINDVKGKKSYSKSIKKDLLMNRRVKDKVPGSLFGLVGYELEIRGGSDSAGFPLRPEIKSPLRKKILVGDSVGVKVKRKGMFKRKTVRGNTIDTNIAQVNLAVSKYGTKKVEELLGVEKEGKTQEGKKEEDKKEKVDNKETKKVEKK